ncbi:hypothetical protein C2G38_2047587 [Gigaspora rosea]|uniref:Uncharacterized protein n=1 Tax=Gigaspora rosea TaxID=44941 RepID=A0A397U8P5_9GLOM|nr:hypothetical protein C2G38_2047587 [Gigaspora rosea]
MEKKPPEKEKEKEETEGKKRKKRKKEEVANNLSTCHFRRRLVFVCGHGYHLICYNAKCIHCEEFYKKGIFKNVKKFLERIEKGANTLTNEDLDDDDEDDVEGMEETIEEVEEALDITSKLLVEIEQIKYW